MQYKYTIKTLKIKKVKHHEYYRTFGSNLRGFIFVSADMNSKSINIVVILSSTSFRILGASFNPSHHTTTHMFKLSTTREETGAAEILIPVL